MIGGFATGDGNASRPTSRASSPKRRLVAARQLSVPRRQIIDGLQQSNAERDNRHQMRHCRGAAGMILGYLLARAGVDVAMLEKPADFFRDFRGGTIHPSTLSRKLFERFLRDVNKLPGAPAWAGRRPQGPTRQTQFGTPQPAPEAQCTTLGACPSTRTRRRGGAARSDAVFGRLVAPAHPLLQGSTELGSAGTCPRRDLHLLAEEP